MDYSRQLSNVYDLWTAVYNILHSIIALKDGMWNLVAIPVYYRDTSYTSDYTIILYIPMCNETHDLIYHTALEILVSCSMNERPLDRCEDRVGTVLSP